MKDRPCAIVLAAEDAGGDLMVMVAPITHTPPRQPGKAVTLASYVKRRLGLDDEPSWIIADEVNRFVWPGPDLRPVSSRRPDQLDWGFLPEDVFAELRRKIVALARAKDLAVVPRTV